MSILSAPYFHSEEAAYAFVEARIWPHGPVCPKCGVIGNSAKLGGTQGRRAESRKFRRIVAGEVFRALAAETTLG